MITTEKTCIKCNTAKTIGEFYKNAVMKDGHSNKCIECTKADAIQTRRKRLDYYRQYDRERAKQPHRTSSAYKRLVMLRKTQPEKDRAHAIVAKAVRAGKLTKGHCVFCGSGKVVGHHEDYSKPLDVIWMCQAHHVQYHKGQLELPVSEEMETV